MKFNIVYPSMLLVTEIEVKYVMLLNNSNVRKYIFFSTSKQLFFVNKIISFRGQPLKLTSLFTFHFLIKYFRKIALFYLVGRGGGWIEKWGVLRRGGY